MLINGLRIPGDAVEIGLDISDSEPGKPVVRTPIEWGINNTEIAAVGSFRRFENHCAIFDRAADWSDLIHGPAQAHRAVPADAPVGWAQADDAAPDTR